MYPLASALYSIVGTTVAGTAVIAVLTMGYDTWQPIVGAALAGFVLAIPATWYVNKLVRENIK
jgi:hypothetical protein